MARRVRKAVIPAAGMGTRFLPATKVVPKEMLPVVDKPVIQYIVEEAAASGIEQVCIVTYRGKHAIEDHFDRNFELEYRLKQSGKTALLEVVVQAARLVEVVFVRQPEPLGNGHAVLCARQVIGDEPFAMLWGDDFTTSQEPVLAQLVRVFERYDASVLAAIRAPRQDWDKYGMIDYDQIDDRTFQVKSIVEKPPIDQSPSDLAQVKGMVLTPEIFEMLASTPPAKGGEIWLQDAVHALLKIQPVYAYLFEGQRYDTGNALGMLIANIELALSRPDMGDALRDYLRTLVGSFGA
ncbi:MAG TPA: UTP--glucose-1-phosphate uridylyltransferase [Chloroflexota bacterium]|nr:UTP--glucose-1-phosphate uridylyltransferase [Chloroflexota bacterium]